MIGAKSNYNTNVAVAVVAVVALFLVGIAVYFSALGVFYAKRVARGNRTGALSAINSTSEGLGLRKDIARFPSASYNAVKLANNSQKSNSSINSNDTMKSTYLADCIRQHIIVMSIVSCALTTLLVCCLVALVCMASCIRFRAKKLTIGTKRDFAPHSWWQSDEGTPRIGYTLLTPGNPDMRRQNVRLYNVSQNYRSGRDSEDIKGLYANFYGSGLSDEDIDTSSESSELSPLTVPPNSSRL